MGNEKRSVGYTRGSIDYYYNCNDFERKKESAFEKKLPKNDALYNVEQIEGKLNENSITQLTCNIWWPVFLSSIVILKKTNHEKNQHRRGMYKLNEAPSMLVKGKENGKHINPTACCKLNETDVVNVNGGEG